jgi:hypothetical protein
MFKRIKERFDNYEWYEFRFRLNSRLDEIFVHPFRKVMYGVQNLSAWFSIIWYDRDWDYCFLYTMLHKKIERMERHIETHHNHEEFQRDVDNLRTIRLALERLMEHDYTIEASKELEERFGELRMEFEEIEGRKGMSRAIFTRDKLDYDNAEEVELERKMTKESYVRAEEAEQRDIALVFDTLKEHVREFWD